MLAEILVTGLGADTDSTTSALAVGRKWGLDHGQAFVGRRALSERQAVGHLMAVLEDFGFDPERSDRANHGQEISLRNCPFLEVVGVNGHVVCPLHLGLMRGVMEASGAPITVSELVPFVQPDRCVARLVFEAAGS